SVGGLVGMIGGLGGFILPITFGVMNDLTGVWTSVFIGMNGFGASAPIADLYKHFGITAEAIVTAAKSKLG
ncbi:MAG: hypothetical protein JKY83_05750, partial [Rhizobiaceae bacterium]|nr:hypothetical protein [Rhizobiaceae bacterium]